VYKLFDESVKLCISLIRRDDAKLGTLYKAIRRARRRYTKILSTKDNNYFDLICANEQYNRLVSWCTLL